MVSAAALAKMGGDFVGEVGGLDGACGALDVVKEAGEGDVDRGCHCDERTADARGPVVLPGMAWEGSLFV